MSEPFRDIQVEVEFPSRLAKFAVKRAAELAGMSTADFIRTAAVEQARRIVDLTEPVEMEFELDSRYHRYQLKHLAASAGVSVSDFVQQIVKDELLHSNSPRRSLRRCHPRTT